MSGVSWPGAPGDGSEAPGADAQRLDEAESRLAAAGWDVSRPDAGELDGRKGTLVVSFVSCETGPP
ncbi:hypothetical protein AB0I28_33275 [Phytomonospora sp. NPDC050363]|uniref:hypothetical protein n=1 Tax=Phytomonospora sp. NPDC050363 TaxID=3155642 RepID=UPI0033C9B1DE